MKILLFGGTTEGRRLSRELARRGAAVTVCVATEHGRTEQGAAPGVRVLTGRKDAAAMTPLAAAADLCVDAAHPYARQVHREIAAACAAAGIPCLRLLREESVLPPDAVVLPSADAAAEYLAGTAGNILLATGAKELPAFAPLGGARLYPRVLPLAESLAACAAAGIPASHIIALQGPFCQKLNEGLLEQFAIRFLVTKDGGAAGGFGEKATAAAALGVRLIVLRRAAEQGYSYEEIVKKCETWKI